MDDRHHLQRLVANEPLVNEMDSLSLSLSQTEGPNNVSQQNRSEHRESRRKNQNIDPNFVIYSPDDDDSSDDEYDGYYDNEEEEDEEIESEFLIIS